MRGRDLRALLLDQLRALGRALALLVQVQAGVEGSLGPAALLDSQQVPNQLLRPRHLEHAPLSVARVLSAHVLHVGGHRGALLLRQPHGQPVVLTRSSRSRSRHALSRTARGDSGMAACAPAAGGGRRELAARTGEDPEHALVQVTTALRFVG